MCEVPPQADEIILHTIGDRYGLESGLELEFNGFPARIGRVILNYLFSPSLVFYFLPGTPG